MKVFSKMTNEIKISIRAYAKKLKVDEAAVRGAIEAGKIKSGVVYIMRMVKGKKKKTPMIIESIATKEWGFVHEQPKAQRGISRSRVADKLDADKNQGNNSGLPGDLNSSEEKDYSYSELIKKIIISPKLPYKDVILRKEILLAAKEKMDLEIKEGTLVKKVDVDKALFAVGDELKKKLHSIPSRCIDDILSASNKIEATNILVFEINQVLLSISQLQSA